MLPRHKKVVYPITIVAVVTAVILPIYSVTRVHADDFYSLKNTPHACSTQAECDALNAGAGSSGTLNSQNAPHVYPPDQTNTQSSGSSKSGKASQDCYATVEEYVNATPNMGNFDKPICPGADSGSDSMNTFDKSTQPTDNKSLGDGSAPNGFRPLDSSINLPAGTEKSTDMAALKAKLTDSTMLLRVEDSASGQPQWAIVPKSSVQGFENYYSTVVSPNMNASSDSNWMVARIIGSAMEDIGLTGLVTNMRVNSNSEFVQANGTNYDTYNSIIDYATSLPGQSEGNIEKIFDNVQQTIVPDSAADNYSMAQALESGIGVCRHEAAVLTNALAADGYNSSIVFDTDHAWVRVSYGGQTFDLDPINYSYVKLPPRNTSSGYQVIPITPVAKPHGFLWPLVSIAYASADAVTSASSSMATSTTEKLCGKIGVCLYIQLPAHIQANSSTTLEVWQATGNDWTITTFLKNPDIKMDFSKVQPVTINILGQDRLAKEHTTVSNGQTVYTLYSNIDDSNGELIIVQIISNRSILQNEDLLAMLAGNNQISKSVVNQVPPTPTTYFSGKNMVIILALIGLVIIGLIGFFVLSKHKHITNVENQS